MDVLKKEKMGDDNLELCSLSAPQAAPMLDQPMGPLGPGPGPRA